VCVLLNMQVELSYIWNWGVTYILFAIFYIFFDARVVQFEINLDNYVSLIK
jgi:hypothetical protein